MTLSKPLPVEFYERDVAVVAQELIGKRLIRTTRDGRMEGIIVEVEAYQAENDSASHSARGKTKRNAAMFGPPAKAYVYSIHARYCMNTVTEEINRPSAVLIRSVQPIVGVDLMKKRRGREDIYNLTRGPARLCEAMAIDKKLLGWDLSLGKRLWISDERISERQTFDTSNILTSPRVGVTSEKEKLLRFYLADNKFVSPYRKHK